ncbi:MAG: hypothetical protein M3245_01920 [Actinomycetota bacterium]|nr:hypothetical protein [Actinomycetota bacterium]
MIAQISLSNDPCCGFINDIPQWFFLLVHVAIFLVALVLGIRAFGAAQSGFGWGFTLFAVAELSYLTYHLNVTLFLFAHTISEVLVLAGILVLGASAARGYARSR